MENKVGIFILITLIVIGVFGYGYIVSDNNNSDSSSYYSEENYNDDSSSSNYSFSDYEEEEIEEKPNPQVGVWVRGEYRLMTLT